MPRLLLGFYLLQYSAAFGQDGGWLPTNDWRIEYSWTLDQKIADNTRCVISLRWVGPELDKALTVQGTVAIETDKHDGHVGEKKPIWVIFTKAKKVASDPKVGCGKVFSLAVESVK